MREWLKEAREKKGFTMKQMGEKLNITESYYCAIEAGTRQRKMDITLAYGLSAALGMSVMEIVNLENK